MSFAIAGVSGHTGRIVADSLLSHGKKVRVVVRDAAKGEPWKARGAEVAIADLGDAAALATALEGAEGAWLLIPPNMGVPKFREYQDRTAAALASAVRQSKIPHVVFLSSVGAQHPAGTGPIAALYGAEKAFSAIGTTTFSFLRAAYFMENVGGSLGMLGQGIVPSFTPASFAFDMIASADIGKLGAQLLLEGASKNQIVELGGPPRSMNDVAAALSAITGKTVNVHEAPVSALASTLAGYGMPAEIAGMYQEMTEGLLSGLVAFEGGHRRVQGTTPLETVLRDLIAAH